MKGGAAALVVALLAAAWLWTRRANDMGQLAEDLSAHLPDRLARWSDAIAGAAAATVPDDFPGGAREWALFGASLMEEESLGGKAPGYRLNPTFAAASDNALWFGTGDSGNAQTPWQLDKHYHQAHLERSDRSPLVDSTYALRLLANNWRHFAYVDELELRKKATLAGYNASLSRVDGALAAGKDPDSVTYPRRGEYVYAKEIVDRFDEWRAA